MAGADTGLQVAADDLAGMLKQNLLLTFRAVAGKTVFFVPLFLWAHHSDIGSAALRGAVGADIFTWIVLSLIDWPFRRLQVSVGLVFEIVLIVIYLNRGPLFDIDGDIETIALSMLFFLLVMIGKTVLWTAERVLDINGVTEPG